jgi:hypothetical protein
MMSHLCNRRVRGLLILARTWFAFGLPSKPGVTLYLPRGFVGHLLPHHSGERALTGLARGSDFDNAGLVGGERRQLQRVELAGSAGSGSAPGAPSRRESSRRAARTGGPPKTSHAARAAFVFLGCPAFAPVRRLCAEVGVRPSGRIRVGICRWADGIVGAEVVAAEEVLVADGITATIRASGLRLFGFDSLSSPLEWGRGRGPCCSSVRPEAIAAVVWPPGAEVVVAAAGAGVSEPLGVSLPHRPSNVGGCSYLRGRNRSSVCNGTLSAGVCSLCLSGPKHVCIFGMKPCFFLISSTRTRLSAN